MQCVEKEVGRFRIIYYSTFVEPGLFIKNLLESEMHSGKGRGGIKIIEVDGLKLVVRKYMHGGLFRGITRDFFTSQKRVVAEADILTYLREQRFPVVSPFCALIEHSFLVKRLYLVTGLEEKSINLLESFQQADKRQRLRLVKKLAHFFWMLEKAGIYHPDLHLRNVLVTPTQDLVFLDFDRARRKSVESKDAESMLWRLGRFVDKMERQGQSAVGSKEKALFLRVYDRLSGRDMGRSMERRAVTKGYIHRIGWFIESLIYRR